MKNNTALQKDLETKDTEIAGLKEYIEKLENIATPSKLKKLNPEKDLINFVVKNEGSSF